MSAQGLSSYSVVEGTSDLIILTCRTFEQLQNGKKRGGKSQRGGFHITTRQQLARIWATQFFRQKNFAKERIRKRTSQNLNGWTFPRLRPRRLAGNTGRPHSPRSPSHHTRCCLTVTSVAPPRHADAEAGARSACLSMHCGTEAHRTRGERTAGGGTIRHARQPGAVCHGPRT